MPRTKKEVVAEEMQQEEVVEVEQETVYEDDIMLDENLEEVDEDAIEGEDAETDEAEDVGEADDVADEAEVNTDEMTDEEVDEELGNIIEQYLHGKERPKKVKKGVVPATKKEKANLYADNDIVLSAKENVLSPRQRRKKAFVELTASLRSRSRLTGRIITTMKKSENFKLPCAVIVYGDEYKVLCPLDELIPENCLPEPDGTKSDMQKDMFIAMKQREDLEVPFVVRGIDETNKLAISSVLEANKQIMFDAWFRKSPKTGQFKLREGVRTVATVTAVMGRTVYVNMHGLEVPIDVKELSYTRITPEEHFYAGQKLHVRILSVERTEGKHNSKGGWEIEPTVNAKLSIKQAQPNPKQTYFDLFEVGQQYTATVNHVDTNGVFVMLADKIEAICFYQQGEVRIPDIGDRLKVRIVKKDDKSFNIFSEIVRILPKPRPLY